jgi:thiamine monophosphate kinase
VRDANHREQTFTAEWGSVRRLAASGVMKDTLKPGDIVVVTGSPGRVADEHKLHLKGIHRPADGWRWKRA